MPVDAKFRAASEAAESWLNTVAVVAHLGQGGAAEMAYRLLLPTSDGVSVRRNLQDQYNEHAEALSLAREELAALSDSPVSWEHGRGLSRIARVPAAVFPPHIWSSAHEAAAGIARMALELLAEPLADVADPERRRTLAKQLLGNRWQALVLPAEEVAALQERIRRERAKLLRVEAQAFLRRQGRRESIPRRPGPAGET